ncbi:MAG: hypothetical protein ABIH41_01570 [Nanoarchaeota archaeon]
MAVLIDRKPLSSLRGNQVRFTTLDDEGITHHILPVSHIVISRDFPTDGSAGNIHDVRDSFQTHHTDMRFAIHGLGRTARIWAHMDRIEQRAILDSKLFYTTSNDAWARRIRADEIDSEERSVLTANHEQILFATAGYHDCYLEAAGPRRALRSLDEKWSEPYCRGIDHGNFGSRTGMLRHLFPIGMAFDPSLPADEQMQSTRHTPLARPLEEIIALVRRHTAALDLEWQDYRKGDAFTGQVFMGVLASEREQTLFELVTPSLEDMVHDMAAPDGFTMAQERTEPDLLALMTAAAQRYGVLAGVNFLRADHLHLRESMTAKIWPDWGMSVHTYTTFRNRARMSGKGRQTSGEVIQSVNPYVLLQRMRDLITVLDLDGIGYRITYGMDDRPVEGMSIIEDAARAFADPMRMYDTGDAQIIDLMHVHARVPELGASSLAAVGELHKQITYDEMAAAVKQPDAERWRKVRSYTAHDGLTTRQLTFDALEALVPQMIMENATLEDLAAKRTTQALLALTRRAREGEHLRATKTHQRRHEHTYTAWANDMRSWRSPRDWLGLLLQDQDISPRAPVGVQEGWLVYPAAILDSFREAYECSPAGAALRDRIEHLTPLQRLYAIRALEMRITEYVHKTAKIMNACSPATQGIAGQRFAHYVAPWEFWNSLDDKEYSIRTMQDWKLGQSISLRTRTAFSNLLCDRPALHRPDEQYYPPTQNAVTLSNRVALWLETLVKLDAPLIGGMIFVQNEPHLLGIPLTRGTLGMNGVNAHGTPRGVFAYAGGPNLYLGMRETDAQARADTKQALLHGTWPGYVHAHHAQRYTPLLRSLRGEQLSLFG